MKRSQRAYTDIHDWLDRTGTNQRKLATAIGISFAQMSMILRGSRECSRVNALKLAGTTGLPVEKLFPWDRRIRIKKIVRSTDQNAAP